MAVQSSLNVDVEPRGDAVVLHVAGRADSVTSEILEQKIREQFDQDCTNLVVDFAGLTYLSSSGIRVLLMAGKTLQEVNGTLTLTSLSDNISSVLSVSGFLKLFDVQESVNDEGPKT